MEFQYNILIVDDITDNIQVAMNILREQNYQFSFASNGKEALQLVSQHRFDLILLDVMMPGIDGFAVCKQIKSEPAFTEIPIIFLTARTDIDSIAKGFKIGAVDYITKPFHAEELIARVTNHLELYASKQLLKFNNLSLATKVENKEKRIAEEIYQFQTDMVTVLTALMEATSDETGKHIRRVAKFSRLLAYYHPEVTDEDAEVIFYAAPMHDIGKIALPNGILSKPSRLTEEEFLTMQTHTTKAHEFLKHSDRIIMKAADIIALQHHEKWNGKGYPNGLKGKDIHLYGRIVAIADVFDALTHKREYKDVWTVEESVNYIKERRGKQFDPELVNIFVEHLDEFIAINES